MTDYAEKILNQFFPSPDCRAVWMNWSNNLKGSISCNLAAMTKPGELAESYLQKLQDAACKSDLQELLRLTAKPEYRTTTLLSCFVHAPQIITIRIWHQGNTYELLYGKVSEVSGHFMCMPDVHFSCYLSEANELFKNAEKLAVKFDMDTAIAIAECIQKAVAFANKKEEEMDNSLTAEQRILQQPWATAMNLSTRARNALHRVGKRTEVVLWDGKSEDKPLQTVQDVAALSPTEIYRIRNMGIVTRNEIRDELKRLGVQSTAWYKV